MVNVTIKQLQKVRSNPIWQPSMKENVFRVVKTTKQSMGSKHDLSYIDAIRMVVAADGWKGLFGRGLRTRWLANSLQSILFTVIWRGLAEKWMTTSKASDETRLRGRERKDNSA